MFDDDFLKDDVNETLQSGNGGEMCGEGRNLFKSALILVDFSASKRRRNAAVSQSRLLDSSTRKEATASDTGRGRREKKQKQGPKIAFG